MKKKKVYLDGSMLTLCMWYKLDNHKHMRFSQPNLTYPKNPSETNKLKSLNLLDFWCWTASQFSDSCKHRPCSKQRQADEDRLQSFPDSLCVHSCPTGAEMIKKGFTHSEATAQSSSLSWWKSSHHVLQHLLISAASLSRKHHCIPTQLCHLFKIL